MAKHYLQLSKILKKLLYDRRMNPSELAREVQMPTPTIHRLVTGKSTRPYRSSLEPIANYFHISVDQLIGNEPLTASWPTSSNNALSPEPSSIKLAPLLDWDHLSDLNKASEFAKKFVPIVGNVSKDCFSLLMPDHSMEPLFPEQTILIFDPDKKPYDRSYVLIQLEEVSVPIFRQLLIDIDKRYLKPLNHELSTYKMRLLGSKDIILATLFESRNNYSKDPITNTMELSHDN